jgi:hypothetical protein
MLNSKQTLNSKPEENRRMKKLLIASVAVFGLAVSSFGQGEVQFTIGATAAQRVWVNTNLIAAGGWYNLGGPTTNGGAPTANIAGQYMFAMFVAPTSYAGLSTSPITPGANDKTPWTNPSWAFTLNYATNIASVGRAAGNYNPDTSVTIPGFTSGTSANLMVIGWNTAVGGTTLAEFLSAYNSGAAGLLYGYSSISSTLIGGNPLPPTALFGAGPGQIPGFVLGPVLVPEPTTFALAGLGAAAMLIFRRRK